MIESLEDKLIRQQLEKRGLYDINNPNKGVKTMSEKNLYAELTADFPAEAFSVDSSRGFNLTSIKAQYIVDRLNQVFGFMNWSHTGEYLEKDGGVIYMGTLNVTVAGKTNRQFAPGYSADKKNVGDAYKSAKTDSLSKAASMYGIGDSVFKGKVDANAVKNGTFKTTVAPVNAVSATVAKVETIAPPITSQAPASFKTRTRSKAQSEVADDGI